MTRRFGRQKVSAVLMNLWAVFLHGISLHSDKSLREVGVLRRTPRLAGATNRRTRPRDRSALALAKPICGTPDRDASPRVLGSCFDLGRTAFAPGSDAICALLQR